MERADVPLPGAHNVANVLAASCVALAFGIEPGAVRAAVRAFRGVPHRMEPVATLGGVRFVNNSMCTNPAAVAASLEAAGGPVVAIAGGKHKGGDLRAMARTLKERARARSYSSARPRPRSPRRWRRRACATWNRRIPCPTRCGARRRARGRGHGDAGAGVRLVRHVHRFRAAGAGVPRCGAGARGGASPEGEEVRA